MKLLLLWDLRLDHHPLSAVGPDGRRWDDSADAVVLAGDIDEGLKGLRWARQAFPGKPIVYVVSNHEFYHRDWVRHLRDLRVLARGWTFTSWSVTAWRSMACASWAARCGSTSRSTVWSRPRPACARRSGA